MLDEQIEAYYNGGLDEKARQNFERRLEEDPALQEQIKSYLLARAAIDHHARTQFKEELKELGKNQTPEPTNPLRRHLGWIMVAAVTLLIMVAFYYLSLKPVTTPEELYTHYFEPLPAEEFLANTKGLDSPEEERLQAFWKKALQAYETQNDQTALPALQELLREENFRSKPAAHLILAILHLRNDDPQEALLTLEEVTSTYYQPYRRWYEGLALLKLGKPEQAHPIFQEITQQTTHPFYQEAQDLVAAL